MANDVERAKVLLTQIEQARAAGNTTRAGVSGALLLGIALYLGHLWVRVTTFDSETYVVELQKQAASTVWPSVRRDLEALSADAVPALSKALENELADLGPRLVEKFSAEALLFQETSAKAMQTALEMHFMAEVSANRETFKGNLDKFKSDSALYEDLMRKLEVAARSWAMHELDTTFAEHIKVLDSINKSVQKLSDQAKKGEASRGGDMDQVVMVFLEIMNTELAGEKR